MQKTIIINIGNELLSGKTVNTHLAYISDRLGSHGMEVTEAHIIPDTKDVIINTLKKVWDENTFIILTGGLGPTKDDLTRYAIAEFFQKNLIFHADTYREIEDRFSVRGMQTPETNRIQALIPENFVVLPNPKGTAPGLMYEADGNCLFCLQGVPTEMKYMMEEYVVPYIKNQQYQVDYFCCDINTYGISESLMAEMLSALVPEEQTNIAWLPHTGRVDIRISGKNIAGCEKVLATVKKILQDFIWGIDQKSPADLLHKILIKNKLTISTAESCTGGLLAATLTKNPGSSTYFMGSIIAYDNGVKNKLLGIEQDLLEKYGAVSEEVAHAMLLGCCDKFHTDIVCAVTGIAGPDGGTPDKPVGTVFIGMKYRDKITIEKCFFTGDREQIRWKSVEKAIMMSLVIHLHQ